MRNSWEPEYASVSQFAEVTCLPCCITSMSNMDEPTYIQADSLKGDRPVDTETDDVRMPSSRVGGPESLPPILQPLATKSKLYCKQSIYLCRKQAAYVFTLKKAMRKNDCSGYLIHIPRP